MSNNQQGQGGGDEPIARAASQLADQASRTAEHQASRTLDRAADTLDQVVEAFRLATDELREQQPQAASVADTAIQQVERTSRYLRDHEPRQLVDGAETFVRRQPALAIGGALVLGLVAGRFLRSASPPTGSDRGSFAQGYGDGSGSYRYTAGSHSGGNGYGPGTASFGAAALGTGIGATGTTIVDDSDLGSRPFDAVSADVNDQTDVISDGTLDDEIEEDAAASDLVTADSEVR